MTIRKFEGHVPSLGAGAWVDESAVVLGDVTLGADTSVWPQSVIRGDVQRIVIGSRTNVQDGTVIHVTHDSDYCPGGQPTLIGDDVTIGHRALLHACTVEDMVLIGMGAVIMDGAVVGKRALVGAGSLVSPGQVLEPECLYVGVPAVRRRPLRASELDFLAYSARNYVRLKDRHVTLPD